MLSDHSPQRGRGGGLFDHCARALDLIDGHRAGDRRGIERPVVLLGFVLRPLDGLLAGQLDLLRICPRPRPFPDRLFRKTISPSLTLMRTRALVSGSTRFIQQPIFSQTSATLPRTCTVLSMYFSGFAASSAIGVRCFSVSGLPSGWAADAHSAEATRTDTTMVGSFMQPLCPKTGRPMRLEEGRLVQSFCRAAPSRASRIFAFSSFLRIRAISSWSISTGALACHSSSDLSQCTTASFRRPMLE